MKRFPKTFRFFLMGLTLVLVGAGCGGPSEAQQLASAPVTLKVWRVFDGDNTFSQITAAYQSLHPNVSFEYSQKAYEEYEDDLLRAFAEGNGPDIFSIHNTWIQEYINLIQPMPSAVTIPYGEVRGTIKKETVYTIKKEPTISFRRLKSEFADSIAKDVIRKVESTEGGNIENKIIGLPLSLDTLALYYNKDLLNAAGIAEPPRTWSEFQAAVAKLTKISAKDQIIQSGAAIGTGRNIERSFDILSLLMMQNGTVMTNDAGSSVQFANDDGEDTYLGAEATRFYTDFANPLKQVYTWNDNMPDSFDAFVTGKTAMFFGYSYHAPLIRAASPKLHFSVSQMPQIDGGKVVNYGNYWVETVAKSTDNIDWAWDFIQFATSQDQVSSYLEAAGRPTARRAMINDQVEDEDLSVFASQILTAKSWYKGKDVEVAERAFYDLIDAALSGDIIEEALSITANKVQQSL